MEKAKPLDAAPRARRRWVWALVLFLTGAAAGAGLLRFGNPSWDRRIYRFQADFSPGYDDGWIPVPAGYTGRWRAWRDGEADPYYVGDYVAGKAHGEHWTRTPTGETGRIRYNHGQRELVTITDAAGGRTETPWVADAVEGEVRSYYPSGQLMLSRVFVKGVENGPGRSWHENGTLESEEEYRDGAPAGTSRFWYPDGKLRLSVTFDRGQLDGPMLEYREDQTLARTSHFAQGRLHGEEVEYDRHGEAMARRYYNKGVLSHADGTPVVDPTLTPDAVETEPVVLSRTEVEPETPAPAADASAPVAAGAGTGAADAGETPEAAAGPPAELTLERARRALVALAARTDGFPEAAADALLKTEAVAAVEGVTAVGPWNLQLGDRAFLIVTGDADLRTGHFHWDGRAWRAAWDE